MGKQDTVITIINETILSYLNEDQNSIAKTQMMLLKTAERDGYISGIEVSANYIMDAAQSVAIEWDRLDNEEKKVYRDTYYNAFLKKIHKNL